MACPHSGELIEIVDITTTEQTAFGEVVLRQRNYDVTVICADCGDLVDSQDVIDRLGIQ
jgi:hypothetical protein